MKKIVSYGYEIYVGDSFRQLSAYLKKTKPSLIFILCDDNTLQHCLPVLVARCPEIRTAEIIEVESGENSKSIEISALIWKTLLENQADRKMLLINLGGGVISDLGGFTASVYKRGVPFIHLPTSLLAMVDASVGGKTGIDFENVKNTIGTFAQPRAVFVNPVFLSTLPPRHTLNGLAEIYKIALVASKTLWRLLQKDVLDEELIAESIKLKNKIVLKDPFDAGQRMILNFGHTIGHALESYFMQAPEPLLHGEAVAAGMITESHLAFQKKLLTKKEFDEIVAILYDRFPLIDLNGLEMDQVLKFMQNDKKKGANALNFSLITKIGACKINVAITPAQIEKGFLFYNSLKDDRA